MSGATNRYFRCPFFGSCVKRPNGKLAIYCEEGSRVIFPDRHGFEVYTDAHCIHDYKACSIAKMLLEHYKEDA